MAVAVDFRLGLERNLDIEYMNYRERLVSVISVENEVLALDRKVGLQVRNSDKANGGNVSDIVTFTVTYLLYRDHAV